MPEDHLQPKSRVLMMPRDTNAAGTIFGGVILSYIDQAGAVGAVAAGCAQVKPAPEPGPAPVVAQESGDRPATPPASPPRSERIRRVEVTTRLDSRALPEDLEVPPAEIEAVSAMVAATMEGIWELAVPLKVNLAVGDNWNEAH